MKKTLVTSSTTEKTTSAVSSSSETATIIRTLLRQNQHINDSNKSITALSEQVDAKRFDELRRIFSKLQSNSELCLVKPSTTDSNVQSNYHKVKEKWNNWLKKQHTEFVNQLSLSIQDGRKSSLRTFMGVIASSPIVMTSSHKNSSNTTGTKDTITRIERINPDLLQKFIYSIMDQSNNEYVAPGYMLELLDVEFIAKYRDVQYYTLTSIKMLAQQLYHQLDKVRKEKKNDDQKVNDDHDYEEEQKEGDNEDDIVTHKEVIGIHAENLLRILLKIQLADDQDDLKPIDVKADNGTCANYLFLPPSCHNVTSHESATLDGHEEDIDDIDNDETQDNEASLDSDDDDDDNECNHKTNQSPTNNNIITKKKNNKLSPVESIKQHRFALQEATLAILKLPIPSRSLKLILQHFPSQILPNAPNPLRFADFCTQAYNMGGVTSLLALNSLFILMTQCGLEYKRFYPSLYNLIEPKVFYAKYRTRFFKLLIKCLSSNHMLPAYLIAAFCKKLCRCALNAPPSGSLFVLALVSNLLRKHEECACIIHRKGPNDDGTMIDPYDSNEKDPGKSRAIESSLWELNALEQHYHPAVSSMAKGCGMESNHTLMHNLDEFLLHTYKSLFEQERKRASNKRRSKVPLTFHKPDGLFIENDTFDGVFDFPIIKKQKKND